MRVRTITTRLIAAGLLSWLAASFSFAQTAQPYRYAPAPDWVKLVQGLRLEGNAPVEEGHSDFLLVDNQVRLSAVTSHYYRSVERLTSQDAVDRAAQLSISIDPDHELALLHEVRVYRKGRFIDKLADARRSLLNREEDLENGRLNGRVTLHLLLQDVRVDDVLDFSYTLERRDPFGERGYNDWFSTQWGEPVRQVRLRILSPADRPLVIRDHGKLGNPVRRETNGLIETSWKGADIAALTDEDSRPNWHLHYPRIEISEFANWDAVRAWMKPLYRVEKLDDPALRELIAEVKSEPTARARLLKALRFVQDDVRYTGIEIGAGAYRPTQPGDVLARRYGDCKDKTLLLVTLMREAGIEAWPALVHSTMGRAVLERAPGPGAFDHVIAKVRLDKKNYWLDATATGQGGDIDTLVQADFGPTLVIDDTHYGLQLIPPREALLPTHQVTETYDLRKGRASPATFTVKTVFREDDADAMRARMRSKTITAISKDYLDYYRKTYAGIRMVKPVVIQDDRAVNVVTLTESYQIDEPFEKEGGDWKFYLEAYVVTERSKKPELVERTTPLARAFPMHVHHEIVAYLPHPWNIEPDVVKISDPAFEYNSKLTYEKDRLHIVYDFRSAADNVPAHRLAEYRRQIQRVHDDAYFTLTDSGSGAAADPKAAAAEPAVPAGPEAAAARPASAAKPLPEAPSGASFVVVIAVLSGMVAGVLAARAVARSRARLKPYHDDAPVGVDGWLLVPGSLTCLLPLIGGLLLVSHLYHHGSTPAYRALAPLAKDLLLAQIALLCVLIALAGFGTWLLWKRIRSWTRMFHAQVVVIIALVALELLSIWQVGFNSVEKYEPLIVPLFVAVASLAISVYVARSQRVRATFVNDWAPIERPASVLPLSAVH
jgi:transglutaminase-like putative cysteine protease